MGRAPCCDKTNVKRGPWSPEEDGILKNFVETYGTGGNWIALPQKAGLKRCGKSCRLRWLNYLRPNIKHGGFTEEEDNIILSLYHSMGSRWSVIASQLPGRTDNDVKNYWNTKLKKKLFAAASGTSCPSTSITTFESSTNNFSLVPQRNNSNFSTGAGVHNMLLPYLPVEEISHQQMLAAPIPLPELMEIPENLHNSGVLFPAQEAAVSSLSPSYSFDNGFSSGSGSRTSTNGSVESDAFLAGLMQHDLTNAFDFQERYPGLLTQLYPHSSTAYPPYSTLLANVSDSEQLNPFHQSLA